MGRKLVASNLELRDPVIYSTLNCSKSRRKNLGQHTDLDGSVVAKQKLRRRST